MADDRVIDLSKIEEAIDDPANADVLKLVKRFAVAQRNHFRGRAADPLMVLDAVRGVVQAALREVPVGEREAVFDDLHGWLDWFEEFLAGIGRPPEGEA